MVKNTKNRIVKKNLTIGSCIFVALFLAAIIIRHSLSVNEIRPNNFNSNNAQENLNYTFADDDWPFWRGRNRDNISQKSFNLDLIHSKKCNFWKAPTQGISHASPIGLNNCIFINDTNEEQNEILATCIDQKTGQKKWSTVIDKDGYMEKHKKNSHVSATPLTDGNNFISVFPSRGAIWAVCVNMGGQIAWKTEVGPYVSEWGYGSSPLLINDILVIAADNRGAKLGRLMATSFLAGIDIKTGKIRWRTRRPEERSYGTPAMLDFENQIEILLAGSGRISSYDANSGTLIWEHKETIERTANTISVFENKIIITYNQPQKKTICLERLSKKPWVKKNWEATNFGADVPTPVIDGDNLYLIDDSGQLYWVKMSSGELIKKTRITRKPVSSSPLIIGETILILDETGSAITINKSLDENTLKTRHLGESVLSSPIVFKNSLIIRSEISVWCFSND